MNQEPLNNRLLQTTRLILEKYITIRIHHVNTGSNDFDETVKRFYTKLIHFQHQRCKKRFSTSFNFNWLIRKLFYEN